MTTVLIVDGDLCTLRVTQRQLSLRAEILVASIADDAFVILAMASVDAIVAANRSPGMSGTELLADVRRRWPKIRRVMYCCVTTPDLAARREDGTIEAFVPKPARDADLLHAILGGAHWSLPAAGKEPNNQGSVE